MPELPEVETTKEGIKPHLEGQNLIQVIVRNTQLRIPVLEDLNNLCQGKTINKISRRSKYIILHLSQGYILIHLGMSGHLRVVPSHTAAGKHDHIDIHCANGNSLRYCDPRRFGLVHYIAEDIDNHPLLKNLGPEPLSHQFNAAYLFQRAKNKKQAIKSLIMDNRIVVGVGNIYATESLFVAGIHPQTAAGELSEQDYIRLTQEIKKTLQAAINVGGTTLRDFYGADGKPGYFNNALYVYGRKNQACFKCSTLIESLKIAGRQSAFCPQCQLFKMSSLKITK